MTFGLTVGGLAGPLSAAERPGPENPTSDAKPADVRPDGKPTDVRPDVRPDDGDHDVEVLHLSCALADEPTDGTRVRVGCQWRASTSRHATGYQLWRIVDRGERELVARVGLDTQGTRDTVPADAHVVRYAVLAVNENGRIVGRSRPQRIELGGGRGPVVEPAPVREAEAGPLRVARQWPLAVR